MLGHAALLLFNETSSTEISDGVTSVKTGFFLNNHKTPLLFVGSNCAIQGFDHEGNERYWNITSDNVLSILLIDIDEDDSFELLAGCEDGQILVFKDDSIMYEIETHSPVVAMCSFGIRYFGFALRNGAFGCYHKNQLSLQQKHKDQVVGICGVFYDPKPSENALVIGFRDGIVETRNYMTGMLQSKV